MAGLGLYAYPVLMAADILRLQGDACAGRRGPEAASGAGARHRRRLQPPLRRDFFPLPEPQIFGAATRVMSLRDGTKKMSKSDSSDYSRINMTDDADAIALEDPPRQDRSRAAARRRSPRSTAAPRPTI